MCQSQTRCTGVHKCRFEGMHPGCRLLLILILISDGTEEPRVHRDASAVSIHFEAERSERALESRDLLVPLSQRDPALNDDILLQ